MAMGLATAIDRRLQRLMIARARHRNPVLRLVPCGWIGLAVAPTATRVRCSLVRIVLAAAAAPAVVVASTLLR